MDFTEILAAFGIPLSISGLIGLFINVIITTVAIIIADKIIAHEIEGKHAFIMAFVAYFVTPLLLTGLALVNIVLPSVAVLYIIPLVVWIGLGEILLKADFKAKLIVAVLAFVIYAALTAIGIPAMMYNLIPF